MKMPNMLRARTLQVLVALWMFRSLADAAPTPQTDLAAYGQGRQAVVSDTVASAQQFYREGDFDKALLYLGRAQRLNPGDTAIQSLVGECQAKAALKREMQKRAPQDPGELKRFIDAKYEDARKDFGRRDFQRATEGFETVWLLAGNYRDTWDHLMKIRSVKASSGPATPAVESSRHTPVNVAQGAEPSAPKAVAAEAAPSAAEQARQAAEKDKQLRQAELDRALAQGKQLLDARQWDEARQAFEKALQLDPKNRQAAKALTQIEKDRKAETDRAAREQEAKAQEQVRLQQEKTRQEAEQQARERQAQIDAGLVQGRQLLEARQWNAAREALDKVLALAPNSREARRLIGQIDSDRKADADRLAREQQAKADEQTRLEQEKIRQEAAQKERERQALIAEALSQGRQLFEARQWDGARQAFDRVVQLDPNNRQARNSLDQIDGARKSEAERAVNEQEEKAREQARLEAERQTRERAAREETERKKAADVTDALEQARTHLRNERFDEAVASFRRALAVDPNNAQAQAGLGDVEKARQAAAERIQSAARAAKIASDLDQAASQQKAGQYDKAIELFQGVLKLDAENKTALKGVERATAAREQALADAQRRETERQDELRRQQIAAKVAAARELENTGNVEQAATAYRDALRDDPENRNAIRGLERCARAVEQKQRPAETAPTPPEPRRSLLGGLAALVGRGKGPEVAATAPKESPAVVANQISPPPATVSTVPVGEPIVPPAPETAVALPPAALPEAAPVVKPPVQAPPPAQPTAPTPAPAVSDTRRQAQGKYDEAQKLIEAGQYERAMTLLTEAVQTDSTFNLARQQARELQALITQAQQKLQAEALAAQEKKAREEAEARRKAEADAEARKKAQAEAAAAPKPAEPPVATPPTPSDDAAQRKQVEAQAARLVDDGRVLVSQQNWDEAERKLREALVLNPLNSQAKGLLTDVERGRQRTAAREAKARVTQAADLIDRGQYAEAVVVLEEVLKSDPKNEDAQKQLRKAQEKIDSQRSGQTARIDTQRRQQIQRLLSEGMTAYRKGDIQTAVQKWNEVLLMDPTNSEATVNLKESNTAYQEFLKNEEAKKRDAEAETAAAGKLEEKITIEVKEGTRLREFLNTLSFVTGINFVIAHGADATIVAKFEDKRLREILDTALPPNGLAWKRESDVITVTPDISPKMFKLDSDLLLKVRRLYETSELQRILWGADSPPIAGIQLSLDDRESLLIMNDTPKNQTKMAEFLESLKAQAPVRLITRMYSVRKDIAEDVKTLVEAMLKTEVVPEYEAERKVILAPQESGAQLIIKDTEEHIREVEKWLQDEKFLQQLKQGIVEVYTINLTPRGVLRVNAEQVEAFARDTKEVIETMLYHEKGVLDAQKEGRRMWYDPATLQLTITDTPDNIKKVAEFIEALPQLEPKMRSKILFLEYATAGDLAGQLEQVLGIAPSGAAGGPAVGNEATFSMRVEDERVFRDLSVRLVRVDENNFADQNDDTCQLVIRTSTAQSSDLSIPEFRSEQFEEFEIYVEKVDPSLTPGEGRARVKVTYRPEYGPGGGGPTGGGPTGQQGPAAPPGGAAAPAAPQLELTPFDDLNAILIRYSDPAQFAELMDWIKQLDVAILQVTVETKFVEVNETIAKEFSSDFQFLNVGKQGIALDDSVLNTRFAQDVDEFRTGLEPPIEYTQNASLLKGVTVLDLITGGQSPLQFRLRFLEEEGLLNVISGPTVTVLNNQQAAFQIQGSTAFGGGYGGYGGGYGGYGGGGYGGGGYGGYGGGGYGGLGGVGGYGGGGYGGGGYGGGGYGGGGYGGYGGGGYGGYGGGGYGGYGGGGGQMVDLEVTPNATRKGQITLDININMTSPQFDQGQQIIQAALGQALQPYTIINTATQPGTIYRTLETNARVKDGGTIVLGGWTHERTRDATSGVPVLRSLPYIGKLVFGRNSRISEKTNLLIFLTAKIVD